MSENLLDIAIEYYDYDFLDDEMVRVIRGLRTRYSKTYIC